MRQTILGKKERIEREIYFSPLLIFHPVYIFLFSENTIHMLPVKKKNTIKKMKSFFPLSLGGLKVVQ